MFDWVGVKGDVGTAVICLGSRGAPKWSEKNEKGLGCKSSRSMEGPWRGEKGEES